MHNVSIWRTSLERPSHEVARLSGLLSDPERERAARFHHQRDYRRFVVARATLRTLLGDRLGVSPKAVPLSARPRGKPTLATGAASEPVHFNVSHSDDVALLAISDREIGIDIERLAPSSDMPQVASHFFATEEAMQFERLNGDERIRFFFRTWVRKEAYLKATGEGIAIDPASISVPDSLPGPIQREDRAGNRVITDRFIVHDLPDVDGYVAAIAMATQILAR